MHDVTIGRGNLSDLFFNYDLSSRRALYKKYANVGAMRDGPAFTDQEYDAAMKADAESFLDCLAGAFDETEREKWVSWLVADFAKRL